MFKKEFHKFVSCLQALSSQNVFYIHSVTEVILYKNKSLNFLLMGAYEQVKHFLVCGEGGGSNSCIGWSDVKRRCHLEV